MAISEARRKSRSRNSNGNNSTPPLVAPPERRKKDSGWGECPRQGRAGGPCASPGPNLTLFRSVASAGGRCTRPPQCRLDVDSVHKTEGELHLREAFLSKQRLIHPWFSCKGSAFLRSSSARTSIMEVCRDACCSTSSSSRNVNSNTAVYTHITMLSCHVYRLSIICPQQQHPLLPITCSLLIVLLVSSCRFP